MSQDSPHDTSVQTTDSVAYCMSVVQSTLFLQSPLKISSEAGLSNTLPVSLDENLLNDSQNIETISKGENLLVKSTCILSTKTEMNYPSVSEPCNLQETTHTNSDMTPGRKTTFEVPTTGLEINERSVLKIPETQMPFPRPIHATTNLTEIEPVTTGPSDCKTNSTDTECTPRPADFITNSTPLRKGRCAEVDQGSRKKSTQTKTPGNKKPCSTSTSRKDTNKHPGANKLFDTATKSQTDDI